MNGYWRWIIISHRYCRNAFTGKKLTYCGTRNKNKKNLPAKTKTVKESENEFSAFFWKKDTPVALVSYVPKPGKNLLLISTGHEDPDICPEPHQNNKPTLVDFYNSQRCGVDVNRERDVKRLQFSACQ